MGKKIRFPDYALKTISLLIAISLWLYVSYEESPKSDYWFENVPVTYINDNLDNYDIKRVTDTERKTVSIKVRGKRNAILGLTSNDIIATVDLLSVKKTGDQNLSYTINFPIDGFEVVDKDPYLVTAKIDKLVKRTVDLKVTTIGNPADNCEIGEITSSVSKVEIKGPEGLVENISMCSAVVDLGGKKIMKNTPVEIDVILDNNSCYEGNDLLISNTYTNVSVNIICEKEISIYADVVNNSLSEINNIKILPEKVTIRGSAQAIEAIQRIETHKFYVSEGYKEQEVLLILPEDIEIKEYIKTVKVTVDYK